MSSAHRHPSTNHDTTYVDSSASSSSDHSDRGTHSHQSSSRRVLAQVLARKERDTRQMQQLLKLTFAKLDEESQRASDAERRATECLSHARSAIDARTQADADAAAVRAELSLYKIQLEQAQREISRAQDFLDNVEARRQDAEQDAARARSVARKLQEERTIEAAREEGKQQGWHEGLRQGILLGRREAENQLRSRRREEEHDRRSRSRQRGHGHGDALFTQVTPESPQQSPSERSSPDHLPQGSTPDIVPLARVPSVPARSTPPNFSSVNSRRTLDGQPYDSPELSPSPPRSRSRSRPHLEAPTPELAHSRPYTPHDNSTPSIIQPIPIPASGSSSIGPLPLPPSPSHSPVHHPSVRIPPDNWIPHAQDPAGDGRLSIFLPPPHELIGRVGVPEGPYDIVATPESGSPAVIPPPPLLSPGPGARRSPEYTYATPDLGPIVRAPKASRSRDRVYAVTPPPPDLGPAFRTRDYLNAPLPPPPPPDLGPASDERTYIPPQRIAQIASNYSRASTHLSEFDLLGPVDHPRQPPNIGPPPAEEDELEYIDAETVPIPRQPITFDPPPQHKPSKGKRPFRGPPPPRNIVLPARLGQAAAQPAFPGQPPYMHPPPVHQQQYMPPPPQAQDEDDAPLQPTATSRRPQRSHTQSSIGIHVEPPSPEDSPPSSGNKRQRRPDLLSPEHAERSLPMPMMENFISYNKPQPQFPHQLPQKERPLTPLPELAGIVPGFEPLSGAPPGGSRRPARMRGASRYPYEAAFVPAGIEYPPSPLQAMAQDLSGKMTAGADEDALPQSNPSGFWNKLRLRRNTVK